MASEFMDRFRFNTENAPDVFYIQNAHRNIPRVRYSLEIRSYSGQTSFRRRTDEQVFRPGLGPAIL